MPKFRSKFFVLCDDLYDYGVRAAAARDDQIHVFAMGIIEAVAHLMGAREAQTARKAYESGIEVGYEQPFEPAHVPPPSLDVEPMEPAAPPPPPEPPAPSGAAPADDDDRAADLARRRAATDKALDAYAAEQRKHYPPPHRRKGSRVRRVDTRRRGRAARYGGPRVNPPVMGVLVPGVEA